MHTTKVSNRDSYYRQHSFIVRDMKKIATFSMNDEIGAICIEKKVFSYIKVMQI